MTRKLLGMCLMLVVVGLAGCWPMTRMVWSPDGQRALVLGKPGDSPSLFLCDANGKLSGPIADAVTAWAWTGDSKHFVVVRLGEKLKTWKEVSALISEERRQRIVDRAEEIREEILKHGPLGGDATRWKVDRFAFMCLRDTHGKALAKKAGAKWKEVEKLQTETWVVQLYRCTETGAEPREVLLRSIDAIFGIRVAPDGKAFAYVANVQDSRMYADVPGEDGLSLLVAPMRPGARPTLVAKPVSFFFDWSPDSRTVAFAKAAGDKPGKEKTLTLGSVDRRQVRGEDGRMLTVLPKAQAVVGVIFHQMLRVRYLRDGRILFAAVEVKLPATAADMPQKACLFAVDPDRPLTVTRLLPRRAADQVGDRLDLFEISPDERYVCIPGSGGEVTILDLTTGDVTELSEIHEGVKKKKDDFNIPTWRTAKELCFVVPPGSPFGSKRRAEIVLWSDGEFRCISKTWPDEIVGIMADEDEPESKTRPARHGLPATKPAKLHR